MSLSYRERGLRRARATAALVCVAAALSLVLSPSTGQTGDGSLKILGDLELPDDWDGGKPSILQVDSKSGKIVTLYESNSTRTAHLLEYDLRKPLPTMTRNADLGPEFIRPFPSAYVNLVESRRQRLLMLATDPALGAINQIQVVDLRTLKQIAVWRLTERLPGFIGWGFTYSPEDDLIYVVGEVIGAFGVQHEIGNPKPPVPGTILALKPTDGSLAWQLTMPNCAVLNTSAIGAMIARSSRYRALYVPCARSYAYPNLAGIQRIRIDPAADPAAAARFPQEFFPISGTWLNEGYRMRGMAAYDPVSDRVLMQSLSLSTPGAWVFDGAISGWVGFIATPTVYQGIGVSAFNGHYYSTTPGQPLLVSPMRGTPVPQGNAFDQVIGGSTGYIYTDPGSNRVFVMITLPSGKQVYRVVDDLTPNEQILEPADYDALTHNLEEGPGTFATFAGGVQGFGSRISVVGGAGGVWEGIRGIQSSTDIHSWPISGVSPGDRALSFASVPSIDLRNPGSSSSAQALAPDTGSDEENRTRQTQIAETCTTVASQIHDARIPDFGPEARPVTTAANGPLGEVLVELADSLDRYCKSHPARTPGIGEPDDREDAEKQLAAACVEAREALGAGPPEGIAAAVHEACQTVGVGSVLATAGERAAWPWPALVCLDPGGGRVEQDLESVGGQGDAHVACDLDGNVSTARATSPGVDIAAGQAHVRIGSSSIDARARRNITTGMVTEITSITNNIQVSIPGVGEVNIGQAQSVARSTAHGRPGTASVEYERSLRDVEIRDGFGRVLREVDRCDLDQEACSQVLDLANSFFQPYLKFHEPAVETRVTPRGAFASVQKAEAEYLNALSTQNDNSRVIPAIELILYRDMAAKSRLVVQMAGVRVNSIYYLAPADDLGGGSRAAHVVIQQVPIQVVVPGATPPPPPAQVIRVIVRTPSGIGGALAGTLVLAVRSPKEALHLAMIWALFGAAVATVARRRALRQAMQERS